MCCGDPKNAEDGGVQCCMQCCNGFACVILMVFWLCMMSVLGHLFFKTNAGLGSFLAFAVVFIIVVIMLVLCSLWFDKSDQFFIGPKLVFIVLFWLLNTLASIAYLTELHSHRSSGFIAVLILWIFQTLLIMRYVYWLYKKSYLVGLQYSICPCDKTVD